MHDVPSPVARWNYHPEFEVHLIRSGHGRYVVGDHIDRFSAGQLVLVGSNLPHHWISDLAAGDVVKDRDVVFQFHPDWLAQCQELLPELSATGGLLHRAARGLEFTGESARRGSAALLSIGETRGAQRVACIFTLLHTLSAAPRDEYAALSSGWRPPADEAYAGDVIDEVFDYLQHNLDGNVTLSAAAHRANMSDSTFSRYFKKMTGSGFADTVRRLRLAKARTLLDNDADLSVNSICYQVGYTNLSNFNRQFRAEHGMTPTDYRRRMSALGTTAAHSR